MIKTPPEPQENLKTYQRKIQEFSLLYDISQMLDQSTNLQNIIEPVIHLMSEKLNLDRGMAVIFNRQADELRIEASYGLTPEEEERGRYRPGEGIVGRVITTGRPALVPDVTQEPSYLGRTRGRKRPPRINTAYLCVPIRIESQIIGALGVERMRTGDVNLDEDIKVLSIIGSMIAQAVKVRRRVKEEQDRLTLQHSWLVPDPDRIYRPPNLIGNSQAIQGVYDQIAQVSGSDATVLIRGESGTGKELVAGAIHYNSPRKDKPFIKVNCAALPESVIESELFGHEKGAFTSAVAKRKGRFELAHGGTIFLDEIGDLSPIIQVKFLRVLQEKEFERVGGSETLKTNVRVVAATNRSLEDLMMKGSFREDLYYRLNVFPIHLPPLRDRKSDLMLLADHFTEKYARANNKQIKRISTPAIELLMSYHWPGNVRELENCIERAVLVSHDGVIHGNHLPPSLQSAESTNTPPAPSLNKALAALEKELVQDALKSSRGNIARAARTLGITERRMGLRVLRYGIDPRRFA
ncbi:MAG: sigma 54-interacting transcriptional regulator [Spirochaetales bacterium]|jgi:Nif-specific regulatory protein|nr:sigma 54-interacting transcriptional regulator [Spirochaetales bacterium]